MLSWVCTNGNGDIQVLVWDFSPIAPPDNLNDQVYYKRNLPPAPRPPVTVALDHIAPGTYLQQVYYIGYRQNDAYTAYLDLGAPSQLTKAQVDAISALASGNPAMSRIIPLSRGLDRYELHPQIAANEVCLIVLRKL